MSSPSSLTKVAKAAKLNSEELGELLEWLREGAEQLSFLDRELQEMADEIDELQDEVIEQELDEKGGV